MNLVIFEWFYLHAQSAVDGAFLGRQNRHSTPPLLAASHESCCPALRQPWPFATAPAHCHHCLTLQLAASSQPSATSSLPILISPSLHHLAELSPSPNLSTPCSRELSPSLSFVLTLEKRPLYNTWPPSTRAQPHIYILIN